MPDARGNPVDNEGRIFVAGNQRWPLAPRPWFQEGLDTPHLQCPNCHNDWVGILVSTGPFIQIFCPECSFAWGPMEMHKPQMTEAVAREMGIAGAPVRPITEDIDIPNVELP